MSCPITSIQTPESIGDELNQAALDALEQAQSVANAQLNGFDSGGFDISSLLDGFPDLEGGSFDPEPIDINFPSKPSFGIVPVSFPDIDTDFEESTFTPLVIPDAPDTTLAEPNYKDLVSPDKFNKDAPDAPVIVDRAYPDAPTADLPAVPSLSSLTLPDAPETLIVAFDDRPPGNIDAPPDLEFFYSESDYTTALLEGLNETLLSFVSGTQTGLDPAVEQQIWDRHRRRASLSARDRIRQIDRNLASSGWDEPGGETRIRYEQSEQEVQNIEAEASRDIAIAQADLEQKNRQLALTTATQLEGILTQYQTGRQQRYLDAAKFSSELAVQYYGLLVQEHNANIEVYKTKAQVYSERIRAELTKVELYKAKLEGQKLISEINNQEIERYKAQLEGVKLIYDIYNAELTGVKTQIEGDALKIQRFESEIKAFESEVRAKSLEYEQYKNEVQAEEVKSKIQQGRADVLKAKSDIFKNIVDGNVAKQNAEIRVRHEVPLEAYKAETEALRTKVMAEAEKIKAYTEKMKAEADVYASEIQGKASEADAKAKIEGVRGEVSAAQIRASADQYRAIAAASTAAGQVAAEATVGLARVKAQIVAGAMGMVNVGVHGSTSRSESNSFSTSSSQSISCSHIETE